jgi:hypothetical protein
VFVASEDGDLRCCIRPLVEFADTHVRHRTTAEAFIAEDDGTYYRVTCSPHGD